jgi:hypothetical protein
MRAMLTSRAGAQRRVGEKVVRWTALSDGIVAPLLSPAPYQNGVNHPRSQAAQQGETETNRKRKVGLAPDTCLGARYPAREGKIEIWIPDADEQPGNDRNEQWSTVATHGHIV